MSPQNASVLSGDSCRQITAQQFRALQPRSFGALLDSCIDVLESNTWSGMTVAQAPFFSPEWVNLIDELTMAYISSEAFGAFTPAVYAALPQTLCGSITDIQLAAVPAENMTVFTPACMRGCQFCFAKISARQVSYA